MQLGDLTGAYGARFESLLSAVIGRVTMRADLKRIGVTPDQIAAKLVTTLGATKFESESRGVFLAEITVAVRLICAGWRAPRTVTR
jgi:hypothetical protein